MNSPSPPMSTLVSMFFALLFLSSLSSSRAETNLVDTICKETIDHTKCLEALESDPRSKYARTFNDLAQLALELAISNAKDSQDFINSMVNDIDGHGQQVLKNCVSWYKAVVGSFTSALQELEQDFMSANYDIRVAADDVSYCESEMVSENVQIPSVTDRIYQVKLYSNIGDVITDKLY